jgi:hypothetical protein
MRLFWSTVAEGTMAVPPDSSLTVEKVIENRRKFIEQCDIDPAIVTAVRFGRAKNDGLVTVLNHPTLDPEKAVLAEAVQKEKLGGQVALFGVVADCPLVAFETPHSLVIAHSGWRGTAGLPIDTVVSDRLEIKGEGIVVQVVRALRDRWGNDVPIRGAMSPGIYWKHYDVHDDVARIFRSRYPEYVKEAGCSDEKGPKYLLDVPGIVEEQLREVEVTDIQRSRICTIEDPSLFSERAWKAGKQKWGRMGVLVVAP